jgi:hypothetical protein
MSDLRQEHFEPILVVETISYQKTSNYKSNMNNCLMKCFGLCSSSEPPSGNYNSNFKQQDLRSILESEKEKNSTAPPILSAQTPWVTAID